MLVLKNKIAVLAILFMAAGCAHIALTPKQTVLWGTNVYIAQYKLYLQQAAREDLTEDQKEVLRVKKDILTDMEAIIKVCNDAIDINEAPPEDMTEDLYYLINRLLELT